MEENEDEPDDVKNATPVDKDIEESSNDETVARQTRVPNKRDKRFHDEKSTLKSNEADKRKSRSREDACRGRKKNKSTKQPQAVPVLVYARPCTFPKLDITPRHCLSRKEYVDLLATPSRKCPSPCSKRTVMKKVRPISARTKELAQPTKQRTMGTLQERGASLPPMMVDNLIKLLEGETCMTPEQAERYFRDKERCARRKDRKKKCKSKSGTKSKNARNPCPSALDEAAVNCQFAMAESFVRSILRWKCPIPKEEFQDIAQVILRRLSFQLEYVPVGEEDRKSQQMRYLADIIACWISGVLFEVAEDHRKELEEELERERLEREEEESEEEEEEEEDEAGPEKVEKQRREDVEDEEEEEEEEEEEDMKSKEKKKAEDAGEAKDKVEQEPSKEGETKGKESEVEEADKNRLEDEEALRQRQEEEEAEKKKQEEEEMERKKNEELEAEKRKQEEEEAEKRKQEEEEEEEIERKKQEEEEAEKRKQEELEAERKKQEEEEAEKRKLEEEEAAERKRKAEEEAEKKREGEIAVEGMPQTEEREEERKEGEEEATPPQEPDADDAAKAAEQKKKKEEEEEAKRKEEERKKKAAEEEEEEEEEERKKKKEEQVPKLTTVEAVGDFGEYFKTDLPFVTLGKILDTVYTILESEEEVTTDADPVRDRIHRAIYEKLTNLIKAEDPASLTENLKDIVDVVAGKIASWLKKLLTESQILLMDGVAAEVESTEIRDWSKLLDNFTQRASDWGNWIHRIVTEAENKRNGKITRGDWQDWTKAVDVNAILWRRFYLEALHHAHHNKMMMVGRNVVKVGQKGSRKDGDEQELKTMDLMMDEVEGEE